MKKRLLIITNSLHGGGAERVLQSLLCSLDRSIYDISLLSVSGGEAGDEYPDWISIKSIFNSRGNIQARYSFKLFVTKVINKSIQFLYDHFSPNFFYKFFIPKGYDIEIAFIEGYATRIISGSSNPCSRKIAWVHIDLLNNHWTDIAYKNRAEEYDAYRRFDDIVCVSESVKTSMETLYPELKCLRVLYNPVDVSHIRRLSEAPYSERHFHKGQITLISLGRLVPQKGYDRLLTILKRLHDEGFVFVMNILGEGPDRPVLERFISDNEMGGYVFILGFQANPYPYLHASDLFVCSSRSEGYSTVITEALILGVPVISTDCAGVNELLGDSIFGLVVKNDDDSLYEGLKCLLSDKRRLDYFRQKSEQRGQCFSKHVLLSKILDLL